LGQVFDFLKGASDRRFYPNKLFFPTSLHATCRTPNKKPAFDRRRANSEKLLNFYGGVVMRPPGGTWPLLPGLPGLP
jgi:hypothetical protein